MRLKLLQIGAGLGRSLLHFPASASPQRILVIKPDHLGDVLLSTPALHRLRQLRPQAFIGGLVGPWAAAILANNPDLDTLLTFPFPGFAREAKKQNFWQPYGMLWSAAQLLRAGHFDQAFLLRDDHWWGAALTMLAAIPHRVGYAVPECKPFLTDPLPWEPTQHVTVQALALVEPSAFAFQRSPLVFKPTEGEVTWARRWVKQHLQPGERLVILHPGTGGPTKLWLPPYWIKVAQNLARRPKVRLLLTGGTNEQHLVEALALALSPSPLTLIGATSVGQLAALQKQASLVLGVDSGPLHLAVSQGTPSIHLFGPSDAKRFGPWGDPSRHRVIQSALECSPCGHFLSCPRGTNPVECMQALQPEDVLQVLSELI